ncbi:MAG: putative lipid II flippase FtsW [Oscillospiraceae bacterium]|nr:putative lipid II flippase FtsW [Oscillospiraceae bacterium]
MTFIIVVLILLGLGILMMFSASYAIAIDEGKDGYYYAFRQLIFAGVGLVAMLIMSFVDYRIFQRGGIALFAYLGSVVMLILVMFIGTDLGTGCQRWINLGFTTFQPSELAKFSIVILFAYLIDKNYDRMKKATVGILPFMVLLGVIALLLMQQPHLSCTLLICVIGLVLMFIGGTRIWHLLIAAFLGALGVVGVVVYKTVVDGVGYFSTRINTWLHPFESEDLAGTWQSRQSLIAIGSGGPLGLGLGESRQKYLYLPEAENDFVFAVVCEELGLIGAITVILLFVLLVVEGFHIASKARDRFGMLITIGFTLQIGLQAFINMAVVSGLVPNTGISLPFFSYGGTALIMQLMQMGIVLNVSRQRYVLGERNKPAEKPAAPEPEYRQNA